MQKLRKPQIWQILKISAFDRVLGGKEKDAWKLFKGVTNGLLGKKRDYNYTPLSCGTFTDEHWERFYHDTSVMEQRYQGH